MSEKKPISQKAPAKTSSKAKANTVKKAAATKKAVVKKKVSSNKKPPKKTTVSAPLDTHSILQEMNSQRENRDQQISTLIAELREGFEAQSSRLDKQGEAHQKEMTGLYQTLQTTFGKIKADSDENEVLNMGAISSLSDAIKQDHELTLAELNEQGKLQDKKIKHMVKVLEQRTVRNRWIAIPGVIIAVIAVVYMFYVVSVMESAMTNMSSNMQFMQKDVSHMAASMVDMSGHIASISQDTGNMSGDMGELNSSVGHMSKDLNLLSRSVAPAMRGMHDMMPWRP